ncbi:MAG: Hsp70 family protein, partial [Bacteroidales bacterium]|nr:Hsp70 family protein [Bacteroidales bacterium]
ENFLKDNGDKVPADKKSEVESALKDLKDAHAKRDIAAIDRATEKLNGILQAASQNMYQNTGANPNADMNQGQNGTSQQQNNSSQNGDNVTDTDFEEVK